MDYRKQFEQETGYNLNKLYREVEDRGILYSKFIPITYEIYYSKYSEWLETKLEHAEIGIMNMEVSKQIKKDTLKDVIQVIDECNTESVGHNNNSCFTDYISKYEIKQAIKDMGGE